MDKKLDAFRTIGEAAGDLDLPQHVLRFWETRFTQIKPMKGGGGRRYYRVGDIDLLRAIKKLLYRDGYTIKGVQRLLREKGGRAILVAAHAGATGGGDAADTHAIDADGVEPASIDADRPGMGRGSEAGAMPLPTPGNSVSTARDAAGLLHFLLGEIEACRDILRDARGG